MAWRFLFPPRKYDFKGYRVDAEREETAPVGRERPGKTMCSLRIDPGRIDPFEN